MHGAGAPSPPSEEGGGCLHKGFEQADGGRDTPSMCESTLYRQWQKQMTAFSLGACLHLDVSSNRALSLPQSFVVAKRRQKPAPSSEGAEAAPPQATELQKCERKAFLSLSPLSPRSGGARKPNPSEGAEAAPPHTTDLARGKLSARRRSGKRQKSCQALFTKFIANFLAKSKTSSQICVLTC